MKSVSNRRLFFAVAISLIAHALFFLLMPHFFPETKKNQMATLELWMKEKEKPKILKSSEDKKPVVAIFERENTVRPDKANFFAEHDQTAPKETKALNQNTGPKNVSEMIAQKEPQTSPNNDEADHKTDDHDQQKPPLHDEVGYKKIRPQSYTAQSKEDPLGIKLKFKRPHISKARAKAFDDYLPTVDEGAKTDLNTWQWRHAPFFNRIKTRISQTWSPQNQISRYDPRGSLLGHKDRVTVMLVTIDRRGFLKDLSITDESGVAYLDEEAVRAFKEAAPFLYPPPELFEGKEEFSFTFAFYLQQNRGVSFDFNW